MRENLANGASVTDVEEKGGKKMVYMWCVKLPSLILEVGEHS